MRFRHRGLTIFMGSCFRRTRPDVRNFRSKEAAKGQFNVFAGTEGSVTLPTLDYYYYRDVAEPGWRRDLNAEVLVAESADTYLRQIDHFARVIRREEAPLVSGLDGVRALQATLAVKEAAATGHAIMLSE